MAGLPRAILIQGCAKKQLISAIKLLFLCVFSLSCASLTVSASPRFNARLAQAADDAQICAFVKLHKVAKTETIFRTSKRYIAVLSKKTAVSQNDVEALLKEGMRSGAVQAYRRFFLVNGFLVKGKASAIRALAARVEVEEVHENYLFQAPDVEYAPATTPAGAVEWGVSSIQAERVWTNFGLTGEQVRIGHLDTGVDAGHADLAGKIAGWAEFDYFGYPVVGSSPHDSGQHGTHTAGILVGGAAGGSSIGAAPGATLLSAMVINGGTGSFAQIIAGLEWIIDPDGNPATDDGADIVSMSLGAGGTFEALVEPIENLVDCGILPVASIGNFGPGLTSSPGNIPSCYGVGAIDASNTIAYFSSGEKVYWDCDYFLGSWVKPDVAAPGCQIKSTVPGGYAYLSGTSMACPFVAAAAALMLAADPTLTPNQLKTVLNITAQDAGDAGKDTSYGWGVINAYQAVKLVLSGEVPDDSMDDLTELPPVAYLYSPQQGKRVWGNAVSVIAGASVSTEEVIFQYKAAEGDWQDMGPADTREPFSLYWDVTGLSAGAYQVRAVAYSENASSSLENEGIEVMISRADADIVENGDGDVSPMGCHERRERVNASHDAEVIIADGTSVIIPAGTVSGDTYLEIANVQSAELSRVLPATEACLEGVGIFRRIEFANGTHVFPTEITLVMPYVDHNDDGVLDNTHIDASSLSIYYLQEDAQGNPVRWVAVAPEETTEGAGDSRASRAAGFRKSVSVRVGEVIVYPNPSYNNTPITFEGLTAQARVRVYTVSGDMVIDHDILGQGSFQWGLTNDSAERVASGVYFYYITNNQGSESKGKIAILR